MSLTEQLNDLNENFKKNIPQHVQDAVLGARAANASSFDPSTTIQVGQTLPPFELKDIAGKTVSSSALLQKGPLLVVFFRGEWCGFCNLTLASFQKHLPQFEAKGVSIVAISPELSDTSSNMVKKHELKFPVLTDLHNKYAEKLGIVYHQPEDLRPLLENHVQGWSRRYDTDSLDIPNPTTLLVDQKGTVRNMFVDPDYSKRLETSVALEWIDTL